MAGKQCCFFKHIFDVDGRRSGKEPCQLPVRFYIDWLGNRDYYCAKHYDIWLTIMRSNIDNPSVVKMLKDNNV